MYDPPISAGLDADFETFAASLLANKLVEVAHGIASRTC